MSHTSELVKVPPGLWDGIRQLGIDASDIARQTKLPESGIMAPEVTAAYYYAIWEAIADLVGGTAQAIIKLVTVFETAKYPPSVLATYHARDYRDALRRMTRYKQLCPPEGLLITEEGSSCAIELEWQSSALPGPPILTGITLACLLELGRRGTGQPLAAKSVEFTDSMGDVPALEDFFGCRIRTGATRNRLTLHRMDLDRPFTSFNEELLEILTPVLEQSVADRHAGRTVGESVKHRLKQTIMKGRPEIKDMAKDLGISERTLQRRLRDEGTSFNSLLSQARHEQAIRLLSDPAFEIKEVAFLVGFEDQNSFYRAFRGWEGDTPSNWRLSQER
jgi:AraC-like DNA-binding protein